MDEMLEEAIRKVRFRDIATAQERLFSDSSPDVKEIIGVLLLSEIVIFVYFLAIEHFYFRASECQYTSEEVINHFWEVVMDRFGLGEPEEGFSYSIRKSHLGFSVTRVCIPEGFFERIDTYSYGSGLDGNNDHKR